MKELEKYLPQWDFAEVNSRVLDGSPQDLYQKLLKADFQKSWVLRGLFLLRGLTIMKFASFREAFSTLSEQPLIMGLIAKPWQFKPEILAHTPEEFIPFDRPGYAKMVWGFTFEPQAEGKTLVGTETRIFCTDRAAFRKFRIYWFFVRPFSNLVRREMLRLIQ